MVLPALKPRLPDLKRCQLIKVALPENVIISYATYNNNGS